MAKIVVKTQLDNSEFTKQSQQLQQELSKLKSTPVKLSVDTEGIDSKAVSAIARLTRAQAELLAQQTKAQQVNAAAQRTETSLAKAKEATAQATERRIADLSDFFKRIFIFHSPISNNSSNIIFKQVRIWLIFFVEIKQINLNLIFIFFIESSLFLRKKARHIITVKTVMTCLTLLYRIIF